MDGAAININYSREAYTHRYRERLRHQKEKQLESTKLWVLSLPQHRLDLRCPDSTASVKVDEFRLPLDPLLSVVRQEVQKGPSGFPPRGSRWRQLGEDDF